LKQPEVRKHLFAELRQATPILRRVAQGEADVRKGRAVPQEKVFKSLRTRLAGK
jgi:predicted transcriptional regulator